MAGTIGDMIQIVLTGAYLDSQFQNVWFYRIEDTPTAGYLEGILTEFDDTVLAAMATTQVVEVAYQSLRALNIFSGDELEHTTLGVAGGAVVTSNALAPSFIAAGYKLVRGNARVRNGYKFINGVEAGWILDNQFTATYLGLAAAVESAFAATLSAGGTDNFAPAIVGRNEYTTSGGKQAYKLPETQLEMDDDWSYVTDVAVNANVTTARSRKLGHGM